MHEQQNFQNNISQPMNNINSQPPINIPKNKKINKKVWITGIVSFIIVLLVIVIIHLVITKKEECSNRDTDISCEEVEIIPTNITYSGFSFLVPTDYSIVVEDTYLEITDNENWSFSISILPYTYESLDIDIVKNHFIDTGYENVSVNEQILEEKDYLVAAITTDGVNSVVAYSKANETSIFSIEIYMKDNTFGTNRLNIVHSILKTAVEK